MHNRTSYHTIYVCDLCEMLGAYRANSIDTHDGNVQLNIQWTKDRGWSCYTAPTLIGCINKVWTQDVMLTLSKRSLDNKAAPI